MVKRIWSYKFRWRIFPGFIQVDGKEAATAVVLWEKLFLEILHNSQENTCARVSFLIKLQAATCNFIKKETLAQVFSCEFCGISKNTFITEHLRATPFWMVIHTKSSFSLFHFEKYFWPLLMKVGEENPIQKVFS